MTGIRIFAALAAVSALALAAAGTAGASTKHCSAGAVCVWTGKHYRGTKYKITEPGNIVNFPAKVNNKVSSAKNRWVNKAFLYEGKGGNGQAFCFASGDNVADFSLFVDSSNNKLSSAFLDEIGGICPPRRSSARAAGHGAAKAGTRCPADTLCLWKRKNYRGRLVKIKRINEISNKLFRRMNDAASSLKNKIDLDGLLFFDKNGGGGSLCFEAAGNPNSKLPDLGMINNEASSSLVGSDRRRAKRGC